MLTLDEIAQQFGVTTQTIKLWQHRGHITGRRIDRRRAHLYHPGQKRPPDGRQRATAQPVPATSHDRPGLVAEDTITTTTTNSPGGAV